MARGYIISLRASPISISIHLYFIRWIPLTSLKFFPKHIDNLIKLE